MVGADREGGECVGRCVSFYCTTCVIRARLDEPTDGLGNTFAGNSLPPLRKRSWLIQRQTLLLPRYCKNLLLCSHSDFFQVAVSLVLTIHDCIDVFNYHVFANCPWCFYNASLLHQEVLRMRPVEHESRGFSWKNLGSDLVTRFRKRGEIDDITRAVSLYREALTSCPPGHPGHDTTLNNLARAPNQI
jgi:hypothetical protein